MSLEQPWISYGNFELNYGCSRGLPTLVPSSELEHNLRIDRNLTGTRHTGAHARPIVHIHAYHIEELKEILAVVAHSLSGCDLILTTDSEAKRSRIQDVLKPVATAFSSSSTLIVENRGRNIGPLFLNVFDQLDPDADCLHLHSKRTDHGDFGSAWLSDLLDSLVGSCEHAKEIMAAFDRDPRLGLVMARTTPGLRPYLNWGSNFELARMICMLEPLEQPPLEMAPLIFPVGMMFWFRPKALQGMARACRKLSPLPVEPLPIDGTVLHALERLTVHFCEAEGRHWGLCGPWSEQCNPGMTPSEEAQRPASQPISVWHELRETYLSATSLLAERSRQKEMECSARTADYARRLEHVTESYEQRLQNLGQELAALKETTSWRITRPLRRLQQMLRSAAGT